MTLTLLTIVQHTSGSRIASCVRFPMSVVVTDTSLDSKLVKLVVIVAIASAST